MEGPSYPEVVKVNVLEKNLSLPKRVYHLLHRLLMWKLGQLCHCIAPPAFLEFCLPNNPAKCVCVCTWLRTDVPGKPWRSHSEGFRGKQPTMGPPVGWRRSKLSRCRFSCSVPPWACSRWLVHGSGEGIG